jgi:predicted nucleic acid-binding protein
MPEKKWIFDTVALSNFVLANSIFILEERYRKCGIITWEVYDEICGGITDYPDLKQVDKLIESNVFNLISLSRAQHKHFLELIGHLGKGEASCVGILKAALLDGQITLNPADDILSKMIKKGFYSPIRSFADIL